MLNQLQLPALARLPTHAHLLQQALAYFQPDPRVQGLVLSGSLAHGPSDAYSDIDLYILVAPGQFDAVFAARAPAAAALGSPLFHFTVDALPGGSADYIVVYEDLIKFDFMYYRTTDVHPHRKWMDGVILKDTEQVLTALQTQSRAHALPAPTPELLRRLNHQFWTWCWYTFGKIMRGEQWEAVDALHHIRSNAIVPLLLWLVQQPNEGYRRLETKLGAQDDRLRATLASLEPTALYDALHAEMVLFVDARTVVFAQHQVVINTAAEDTVRTAIAHHWQARQPHGAGA